MKTRRQSAILDIVDRERIGSQEELRRRLLHRGFEATQATLSRDIRELGLVKRPADGAYHRPSDGGAAGPMALGRAVAEYLTSIDRSQQLVIIRTGAGQAQPLALAIDRSALDGVIGTVAGDDTILAVCRDATQAAALVTMLKEMA